MKLETFFEKFDQFAGAPDAAAKIRELVLRLAMQGELSASCKSDRPVCDLLSQVEQEKERFGIKRSPKIASGDLDVSANEAAHAIPARWTLVRFGEIARHNAGKTLDKGRNRGELRDYITTSNLYWGYFQLDSVRQIPIQKNELDRCTAVKGDLLICEGGEAGRAAVWPHDYEIVFQNHVHRARFFAGINPYYVQRYFEKLSATGEIDNFRKGVGISNMSGKALASIPIPLPPLAEQKRIVAKVAELMGLCDQLEAQQQDRDTRHAALARASLTRFADAPTPGNLQFLFHKSYDIDPADLRKSILTLAVQGKLVPQDPSDEPVEELLMRSLVERKELKRTKASQVHMLSADETLGYVLPESWRWQRLEDLLVFGPTNGISPKSVDYETPVRSLTLSATTSGDFKGEHSKFITIEVPADSDLWLRNGDILVQRGNTIEYVGVAAVYRGENNKFVYPDLMMKLRVSSSFDVSFIHIALSHQAARDFLRSRASGTSGSMPKINQATLKSLPVPIPPLAEQRRIVSKVDQLMALVDELETQLTASRATARNLLEAVVAGLTAAGE